MIFLALVEVDEVNSYKGKGIARSFFIDPIMLLLSIIINLTGFVGVFKELLRFITLFIVTHVMYLLLDLLTVTSVMFVMRIVSMTILIAYAASIRRKLMYSWFSTPGI